MKRVVTVLHPLLAALALLVALVVFSFLLEPRETATSLLRLFHHLTRTMPAAPLYGTYTADDLITVTDYRTVAVPSVTNDQREILRMIHQLGLTNTMQKVYEDPAYASSDGECHGAAHIVGGMAFDLLGVEAFEQCTTLCFSGCYHGALQRMGGRAGPDAVSLPRQLEELCSTRNTAFEREQCFHGAGHGFLLEARYDRDAALTACESFEGALDVFYCYGGVFMENMVGDGRDQRMSSDDPQYPCNAYADNPSAQEACYRLQPTYFLELNNNDYAKTKEECLRAPAAMQPACFRRMGQLSGVDTSDPPGNTERFCNSIPGAYFDDCIRGGVHQVINFNGIDRAGTAAFFCQALQAPSAKQICYAYYAEQIPKLFNNKEERLTLCDLFEAPYDESCRLMQ